jgi:hypothetical protein
VSERVEWFQWFVSETGYQCLSTTRAAGSAGQSGSAECVAERLPTKRRAYEPLVEHTGLFRTFAALPDDKDAIVAFADRYGLLVGGNEMMFVPLPRGDRGARSTVVIGGNLGSVPAERLETWRSEIAEMRELSDLWCAAKAADLKKLNLLLTWHGDDTVVYHHAGGRQEVVWRKKREPLPLSEGELIKPAQFYLAKRLTQRLEGDKEHPALASPALIWDLDKNAPVLVLTPKNLLGALWLQFAQAVSGNKVFRECDECSTWFEVSKAAFRINRMYCSGACKAKAYRRRREEPKPARKPRKK